MKRHFLAITLMLLIALTATAQKQLEILHTNDTHSCILPLNPNLADTAVAGRGGYLRRLKMIKAASATRSCCSSTAATFRKVRPTTRSSKEMWKWS